MKPSRIARAWLLLAVPIAALAPVTNAQQVASTFPTGLSPRELSDPLEQLSLEPELASLPPAPAPLPETPSGPDTSRAAPPGAIAPPGAAAGAGASSEPASTERVLVVKCRQLLVSDPLKADRLVQLLRGGASLEKALKTLGGGEVDESTREYAVDDLQPDLRAEVERLAPGGWSSVRPWRGRSALFQVVSKEERERGSVPALGQGLDPEELERLAMLQRPGGTPVPRSDAQASDLQPAAVVKQTQPQYPEGIQESAEVSVQVEVGLSDDFLSARVLRSTNTIFDQPALDAAQTSTYRSARRGGVPERGTVTLNFRFVAPSQVPPGQVPPGQVPPGQAPPDTTRGHD